VGQLEVGRLEEAITAFRQDLAICRQVSDRHGEGMTLDNLGVALRMVGRFDEVIAAHQEAAAIFRETGDRDLERQALGDVELDRDTRRT
jgi:tetratricopeptide (TPR) repeat protein